MERFFPKENNAFDFAHCGYRYCIHTIATPNTRGLMHKATPSSPRPTSPCQESSKHGARYFRGTR